MTRSSYEQEFQIFSANINQTARSFYYHLEINKQVYEDGIKHQSMPNGYFQDSKTFQAMQSNARFWEDYKHCGIVFSIITLGRVLDKNKNSHKIERLINTAKSSGLFASQKLRERKINGSDNAEEWIDDYMKNAYELSNKDFLDIENYTKEIRDKWDTVKPLRHKIYAHQEIMTDLEKTEIFKKAEYAVFEDIILRLLTLENIFFQAYNNGIKPDFNYENKNVKEAVVQDVRKLLERLSA